MNNILFFLTPKAMCAYLYDDYTIRQALEKMESAGYAAIPILNHRGEYRGTLTEGDLLWAMKNMCYMDMRQAEARRVMEIARRKDNVPVRVTTSMHELVERAGTGYFSGLADLPPRPPEARQSQLGADGICLRRASGSASGRGCVVPRCTAQKGVYRRRIAGDHPRGHPPCVPPDDRHSGSHPAFKLCGQAAFCAVKET